jgi:hypothetical protein
MMSMQQLFFLSPRNESLALSLFFEPRYQIFEKTLGEIWIFLCEDRVTWPWFTLILVGRPWVSAIRF